MSVRNAALARGARTAVVLAVLVAQPLVAPALGAPETATSGTQGRHLLVEVTDTGLVPGAAQVRPGWVRLPLRAGEAVSTARERVARIPGVIRSEMETFAHLHAFPDSPPNDPFFPDQWNLRVIGAQEAWKVTGGAGATVAVLDGGIQDVAGLNCRNQVYPLRVRSLFEAVPNDTTIGDGHGTAVATALAACTDDGWGTAGVAFDIDLMPVVVCEDLGSGMTCPASHVAGGIDWAVSHGADVLNLSLGWPDSTPVPVVQAAIDDAVAAGAIVVASAGNGDGAPVVFPASHPPVIAVGSIDGLFGRAFHSNRGAALDLVAPGVKIFVETDPAWCGSQFCWAQGTSFAAPHVSAGAAMLVAIGASPADVEEILEYTAVDLGVMGFDQDFGNGLIDLPRALSVAAGCPKTEPTLSGSDIGETLTGSLGDDIIWALGGSDVVNGLGGNDILCGGDGDDLMRAGPGTTDMYGGAGVDACDYLVGAGARSGCERALLPDHYVSTSVACVGPYWCESYGWVDLTQGTWSYPDYLDGDPDQEPAGFSFYYGDPWDVPFLGDWDCDGVDTPGLYRQSDGYVYLRNSLTQGVADLSFFFGDPGDVPLAGDFDGDGCDTVSIYRPSEARFYIINKLGSADDGLGAAEYSFLFGNIGDKPFVGDFDDDGIDEVALHRESSGRVYYRLTLTQGAADFDFIYGNPGDVMLAADWDGDGDDSLAVYRPSDGLLYIKLENSQGNADIVQRVVSAGRVGAAVGMVAGMSANLADG